MLDILDHLSFELYWIFRGGSLVVWLGSLRLCPHALFLLYMARQDIASVEWRENEKMWTNTQCIENLEKLNKIVAFLDKFI